MFPAADELWRQLRECREQRDQYSRWLDEHWRSLERVEDASGALTREDVFWLIYLRALAIVEEDLREAALLADLGSRSQP